MNAPTDPTPELAALLRLKRYEQPPPGYVEEMVRRVQQRQRTAWQRLTPWQWWKECVAATWAGASWWQPARLAAAGAVLMVCAGAVRLALPQGQPFRELTTGKVPAKVTPQEVLPLPESVSPLPQVRLVSDGQADEETTEANNGLRRTAGDHWVLPTATGGAANNGATTSPSSWDERVVLVR